MTADELYAAYRAAIRDAVEAVGRDAAAAGTDVAPDVIEALLADDGEGSAGTPDLTLEEATSLLALTADTSGEEMAALAREDLLIGMSTAVLDVDTLAARVDGDLEPREIQSKVEGRFPMTLREFALLRSYLATQGA